MSQANPQCGKTFREQQHIIAHNLFPCFIGSTFLSASLNLQRNTFSPNHRHHFLKHVRTVLEKWHLDIGQIPVDLRIPH